MFRPLRALSALALAILIPGSLLAQEPTPHKMVVYQMDSGVVDARSSAGTPSGDLEVVYEETVRFDGAPWLRLFFSEAQLGSAGGSAAIIRLTSLEDGAMQTLDSAALAQWQNSSAFFNGDRVRVEILSPADAGPSRIALHELMVGEPSDGATESICGPDDDRALSSDPRNARVVPVGCTVWLIDDAEGCFLTAGHCITDGNLHVVEFNVPLSDADGTINHPAPIDQYPVDLASIQGTSGGIGNDWSYFGAFPNSQSQLAPAEVQGSTYVVGDPTGLPLGSDIRITGFGSTTGTQGAPLDWNQVQTTHVGPLAFMSGSNLQYTTDTTGGDSGSPVVDETSGDAIGIHTHAGCNAGGGANNGTNILLPAVQNALSNPLGVCTDGQRPLRIDIVSPLDAPVSPTGSTFQVAILDRAGSAATLNSATFTYDAGGGDQIVPLVSQGSGIWQGDLPSIACGDEITVRVDAEAANGTTVSHPYSADPSVDRRYRRWVGYAYDVLFRDNFESANGWTVDDDPGLTAGSWERGLPSGYGFRQDPAWDADTEGDGLAFLTDPAGGNTDVDGGSTRLVSPTLDASGHPDAEISYWRWWDDGGAGDPSDDTFVVEISDDNGSSWTTLESIGPGVDGAWVHQSFRVADFVAASNQLRIRFTAGDVGAPDIIEAAIDGVTLRASNDPPVLCSEIFSDGFESGDTTAW